MLRQWERAQAVPWGRWLFMLMVRRMVPYTGALGSRMVELRPGLARVELDDRRGVRNHLGSIHAVALVNLGEFAGGMAMLTALPPGVRGIVTRLEAEYLKKARGRLSAVGEAAPPEVDGEEEFRVATRITDADGDVVAVVTATWNLRRSAGQRGVGETPGGGSTPPGGSAS